MCRGEGGVIHSTIHTVIHNQEGLWMRWQFVLVGVALLLSIGALFVGVGCWFALSRLRTSKFIRSARSLAELSNEVNDLRSLFKLLQDQQKRFAARTGGRPPKSPTDASPDWKKRARAQLALNIANRRPPAEGIRSEGD